VTLLCIVENQNRCKSFPGRNGSNGCANFLLKRSSDVKTEENVAYLASRIPRARRLRPLHTRLSAIGEQVAPI